MSQEIQVYRDLNSQMNAIERTGLLFSKSGMFGCEKFEQGFVLALECVAQHKTPSEILRRYHIVEGRLSLKSNCALADFRKSGGRHRWKVTGDQANGAKPEEHFAEAWFKAPDGEELTYRYSMADAYRECVVRKGSRWEKRPGQMLRARVISNALGMLTPEVYGGDDDEVDSPAAPAAALDLAAKPEPVKVVVSAPVSEPPKPATAPESKPAPKVIDVPTTVIPATEFRDSPKTDQPELAKPGLAPAEPAGELDAETLKELEAAIGDIAPQAVAWLRKQGWIKPEQGFEHLPKNGGQGALRIIKYKDSFRNAILGGKP